LPKDSIRLQTMTTFNKKLLRMFHGSRGAVFSKRAPLAAGGKSYGGIGAIFCLDKSWLEMLLFHSSTIPSFQVGRKRMVG
jgi:hypothetical protein